jgi:hypothetical protein
MPAHSYASRSSILIGILAIPCLFIIAEVWQKLKNAKGSEKHIEKLQNTIAELEQGQKEKWKQNERELEQKPTTKLAGDSIQGETGHHAGRT